MGYEWKWPTGETYGVKIAKNCVSAEKFKDKRFQNWVKNGHLVLLRQRSIT